MIDAVPEFTHVMATRRLAGRPDEALRVIVPCPYQVSEEAEASLAVRVAMLEASAAEGRDADPGRWLPVPSSARENTLAQCVRRWMREGFVNCRPVKMAGVTRLLWRVTPKGRALLFRLRGTLAPRALA